MSIPPGIKDEGSRIDCLGGFTLIEMLIVLVFFGLMAGGALLTIRNQLLGNLENDASIIKTRLSEAQSRALAGLEGSAWGIHFNNASTTPYYALFPGLAYSNNASGTYFLSAAVEFQTPASGTSTNTVFSKLSGTIATTTSITIRLKGNTSQTKTIKTSSQGIITVE